MHTIRAEPLEAAAFAPFGDVLQAVGAPDLRINGGLAARFHDRARLDFGEGGRAGISLVDAEARTLPYKFDLLERHPLASQAFIPMAQAPFLVIVAPDRGGCPGRPRAFLTRPGQGINLLRGAWHGVLTPLFRPGLFAVIDRIGPGENLQEFLLPHPFEVLTR